MPKINENEFYSRSVAMQNAIDFAVKSHEAISSIQESEDIKLIKDITKCLNKINKSISKLKETKGKYVYRYRQNIK